MNGLDLRVGHGTDVHRLVRGRRLILGGVEIDHDCGLDGHSDADVLLHAIIDALLGAAGLGDIGEWFPNDDSRFLNADSRQLVATALEGIRDAGWELVNLDCTVFAQRPRLTEWKPRIRASLSSLLQLPDDRVNVKAKSGERVGFVGREEAMEAEAVVLLCRQTLD